MLPLTPPRKRPPLPPARARGGLPRWTLSVEALLLLASAWIAAVPNRSFVGAALDGRAGGAGWWAFAAALVVGLAALHLLLLLLVSTRHTIKPVLALLVVVSAVASYYMGRYGTVLDPTMLRNVLATHWTEASELLGPSLLWHLLLLAGLPLLLLWRVDVALLPWRRTLVRRSALALAAVLVLAAALLSAYQPFSSLMRNQKELRYRITPANVVWSVASVARADARTRGQPRTPIGEDARLGSTAPARPRVVVLVVGETARAANWGLSGYARATTPELARLPVLNFAQVEACGTNTETSLPCMFAPVGRRDYDEDRIRASQSLLHVLARAGVGVTWRDNQSGCKGVCEGLPSQSVRELAPPGLCDDARCFDEGLLHGLPDMLRHATGTQLLVLHQLGNHGPSYFRRYPPAFARFQPECRQDDLARCTQEEIVNAYDNALLYTDHLLARLQRELQAQSDRIDTAMIYVSDHGESLGESNLYLHGLPYAIAPDVQKRVPMVMWLSDGLQAARGVDGSCLRARAARPASHDHLFHTLLTLLDVRTALHDPAWDLLDGCRRASTAP